MSLFAPDIKMQPTRAEWEILDRPIVGDGGHQDLLRECLASVDPAGGRWRLEDGLLQKCYRYAYDYGGGGYQDRFRVIVTVARRGGWVEP